MSNAPVPPIRAAGVVLPCPDLTPTLTFFTDLGFELESIAPADDPRRATVVGFGLRIHLDPDPRIEPGTLRLFCDEAAGVGADTHTAPNGTTVEIIVDSVVVPVPLGQPAYGIARGSEATWSTGRAGMRYRDLMPDRAGGAMVASMIHIADGGTVPDYAHYHRVAFQLIYCASGWVEVVYEDQGAPFVLEQGDAVLQPPGIRHQVRESSDELVVIEITVPADHETIADPRMELPTETFRPGRRFGDQRFVRHLANRSLWVPWNASSTFEGQRLRIDVPTNHLASAWTVRAADAAETGVDRGPATSLLVVLDGDGEIQVAGHDATEIGVSDALTVPPDHDWRLTASEEFEMLLVQVTLPTA